VAKHLPGFGYIGPILLSSLIQRLSKMQAVWNDWNIARQSLPQKSGK
jgi:hypothetical protein